MSEICEKHHVLKRSCEICELEQIIHDLKHELIVAYKRRGSFYVAGEKESIEERIRELEHQSPI